MNKQKITLREKLSGNNKKTLYFQFTPALRNPDTFMPQHSMALGKYVYSEFKTQRIGNKASYVFGKSIDKYGKQQKIKNALSNTQKMHNAMTLKQAETLCVKYQDMINKGDCSFLSKKKYSTDFLAFFKDFAESKKTSNKSQFQCSLKQLSSFTGNALLTKEIDYKFCEKFMNYLLDNNKLKQNTKHAYFRKFKIVVKDADKKGIVTKGLFEQIYDLNIKEVDTNIEYLTLAELKKLKETSCTNDLYKQAALFSAVTGLRRSDCILMGWDNVKSSNHGRYIDFAQLKTRGILHAPLNGIALDILNAEKGNGDKPFEKLTQRSWSEQDIELKMWVRDAGINKKITFHCFRHSFAVALIASGIDIFTVSKMLGHKSILTTVKTYAKVMNSSKQKAVNNIVF